MDANRIRQIQSALEDSTVIEALRDHGVSSTELDLVCELAVSSTLGSNGVAGVLLNYGSGPSHLLTAAEWRKLPVEVLAQPGVTAKALTPREYAEQLEAQRGEE